MIITINGDAGSGKNTVGKLLAEKLKFKFYCIGDIRRDMAKKRGMDLEEFNKLGENESFTDLEVDSYQQDLGVREDNFVMVGRTSFHFIPDSKKIYLEVRPEVGAERVMKDKKRGKTEQYKDLEEAKKKLEERKQGDAKRYGKYYNLDVYDTKKHDLIVDTSDMTAEQVVEKIMEFVKEKQKTL